MWVHGVKLSEQPAQTAQTRLTKLDKTQSSAPNWDVNNGKFFIPLFEQCCSRRGAGVSQVTLLSSRLLP